MINTITGLKAADGSSVANIQGMQDIVVVYFGSLFSSMDPSNIEEVIQHIPSKVSETMNDYLQRSCSKDEVLQALKQMQPGKSPGPDGMNPFFFSKILDSYG